MTLYMPFFFLGGIFGMRLVAGVLTTLTPLSPTYWLDAAFVGSLIHDDSGRMLLNSVNLGPHFSWFLRPRCMSGYASGPYSSALMTSAFSSMLSNCLRSLFSLDSVIFFEEKFARPEPTMSS